MLFSVVYVAITAGCRSHKVLCGVVGGAVAAATEALMNKVRLNLKYVICRGVCYIAAGCRPQDVLYGVVNGAIAAATKALMNKAGLCFGMCW